MNENQVYNIFLGHSAEVPKEFQKLELKKKSSLCNSFNLNFDEISHVSGSSCRKLPKFTIQTKSQFFLYHWL